MSGKPIGRDANVGRVASNSVKTHLLYIYDKVSGKGFLVDSGASVSLFPVEDKSEPDTESNLLAANGSKITTYGEKLCSLDFGFRRKFVWPFIVANTCYPILGLDFLTHYKLLLDPYARTITDATTGISVSATCREITPDVLSAIHSGPQVELLSKYPNISKEYESFPPVKHSYRHHIPTNGKPPFFRPRRLNPKMYSVAKELFEKMMQEGIVRPSKSAFASPLHIVPKKQGWRPVGDYRALNQITERDSYPLPFLQDFSMSLYGMTTFSRLDLKDAFFNIPIADEDVHKTCVTTPFGAYEFVRMNFGLCGAAQTFQRYMDSALRNLTVSLPDGTSRPVSVFAYVDDLLVASGSEEDHKQDLDAVFQRLSDCDLRLNLVKCSFFQTDIDFLGHKITCNGLHPLPEKVSAIRSFPLPTTYKDLRSFLGMVNFYHRFIDHGAEILGPLNNLLSRYTKQAGNRTIKWSEHPEARAAFDVAKNALAEATMLHFPSSTGELAIFTDASDFAVAGVLQQYRDGSWLPLGFFSRKLVPRERILSTFSRELLAIYLSLKHFSHWTEGQDISIFTDHKPILGAMNKPLDKLSPKEARHIAYISQLNPKIFHISGKENIVADALSRPSESAVSCQVVESECALYHELKDRLYAAQLVDEELKTLLSGENSLNLKINDGIYCDISDLGCRPYVPLPLRKVVFDSVHNLSHPGVKQSLKQVCSRFVWPNIKKTVKSWVRSCERCQKAKVHLHNKAAIQSIPSNVPKFSNVHVDLVGPLPPSGGFTYLLTAIDRFSRWPVAIPIKDIAAETVVSAFMHQWVSHYGVPEVVTTDRGSQFEGALFNKLLSALGCSRNRTTSYHPQSNGLIERFHRTLKNALRACQPSPWFESLPFVMLSLRVAYREDMSCSPAEVVFGTSLRLPIDLIRGRDSSQPLNLRSYVDNLREVMQKILPPVSRSLPNEKDKTLKNLDTCPYVFVRNETKRGLQANYRGPFRVLNRNEKYFTVQLDKCVDTVSIDRLKPAFRLEDLDREGDVDAFLSLNPVPVPQTDNSPLTERANLDVSSRASVELAPASRIPVRTLKSSRSTAGSSVSFTPGVQQTRTGRVVRRPLRYT